jgi:glucose/arabinose dehydrogenase
MSMNNKLFTIAGAILFLFSCSNGAKNDLRDLLDAENGNFITSEKLNYKIDTIASGLNSAWGLTFLPNRDLLVTEKKGEIRVIRDGKLLDTKIGGVPEVFSNGQGGLFEIELHPQYETNGWLYLIYAAPGNGGANTAIMRAKLDGLNLTQKQVIFQAEPLLSGGNHFGGRMDFDKNGYLYFTVGERDRRENAQNLKNHSGKILRIKDDGTIPADNPFVNTKDAKPEIYTYGNRNPQGMVIHPVTGEIWTHEHGPMGGDEINIVEAGVNYGWPEVTFGKNYNGTTISDLTTKSGMKDPLHYWLPSIAPCGMSFVSGDLYPAWNGNLLVGSLKFRYVARVELEGTKVVHEEKLLENLGRIRSVTQGPDGYIYVGTESPGLVVRIIPQ